ncbi:neocarzinostatin apoprotein domain-containing protein [Nocardia sp. CDC159]|uniref:Neocarzinostatin apoprotein domain-containing protein n=1 Tax=Nocardia pulmonis TaxID=2951408 RepID=A0A9X2E5F9_9NOCA|nr:MULTISPECIES: neocarzinostatin apoprotein domain-containing protein [Nocardia]MCM6771928.1 neocarzinostatin apoprotein domain-containing protein [Nocardia pulmonis]MCM6785414.1 neocarzinostatin apoprotein domain-containing protein [Nocardia sp. CDC159]
MKTLAVSTGLVCATATALVALAPSAAAAPELRPSQTDKVTVGQAISISLDGLPPNMPQVAVGQCKPQITTPGDCNLTGSLLGNADAQGAWRSLNGATSVTLTATVGGVDCTAAPGACTLAVTSLMNPAQILTSVPLNFTSAAATTTPAPVQDSTAAAEDSDSGNTALVIGIAAAAVVVLGAIAGLILARRRRTR